jgi:hypothetical protein
MTVKYSARICDGLTLIAALYFLVSPALRAKLRYLETWSMFNSAANYCYLMVFSGPLANSTKLDLSFMPELRTHAIRVIDLANEIEALGSLYCKQPVARRVDAARVSATCWVADQWKSVIREKELHCL